MYNNNINEIHKFPSFVFGEINSHQTWGVQMGTIRGYSVHKPRNISRDHSPTHCWLKCPFICPVFAVLATDCQLQIVPAVCIGSCKHEGVETPKNISWNIECVRQYFCFGAQASPQTSEGEKHNNVGLLYFKSSPPRPNLAIVSSISSGTIRGIYFPTLYFSILPGMYSGLLSAIHLAFILEFILVVFSHSL